MRKIILAVLFFVPTLCTAQESIIADLSRRSVAITTTFTGSEILIFGAVKRAVPVVTLDRLDVIITVAGPAEEVVVRKKNRVGIIWANSEEFTVQEVPSFYAILTSSPVDEILSADEDRRHNITTRQLLNVAEEAQTFEEALIRIKRDSGAYQLVEGSVSIQDETLFRTSIQLPANIIEGDYQAEIFLTRGQEVVSKYTATLEVKKEGLERFVYNLAHDMALVYGIMSIVIAIIAGWLASAVFRWLKY